MENRKPLRATLKIISKLKNDNSFPELEIVAMARKQFTQLLEISGIGSTQNSCVFASHYLYMLLNRFSKTLDEVALCGGGAIPSDHDDVTSLLTGVLVNPIRRESHMWVRAVVNGTPWILDISADQFGFSQVVHLKEENAHPIYLADPQPITESVLQSAYENDPVLAQMAGHRVNKSSGVN